MNSYEKITKILGITASLLLLIAFVLEELLL